jgi:hypothetical protein
LVTSPEAIKHYLDRKFYVPPSLKGADPAELEAIIHDATGRYPRLRTEARPHQLEGLAFALWAKRALLFYGMRLGKTKIALDWAAHLKAAGLWSGLGLVIAHAPIGLDVWAHEAKKHSHMRVRVVHLSKDRLLEAIDDANLDLLIVTWSGLYQMVTQKKEVKRGKRKGEMKLYPDRPLLRRIAAHIDLGIIDEIQECKNFEALPFALAEELLGNASFRLGITGTPIGRDPLPIWALAKLIDNGQTFGNNPMFFREAFSKRQYSHFARSNSELVFDKAKEPILAARLAAISMSYARAEVTQDRIEHNIIELSMRGQQRDAYNACLDKIIDLGPNIPPVEIGNSFSRLRMIASGYLPFRDEQGQERLVSFPDSAKEQWLIELLHEAPPGQPMLIFHEYVETGRHICAILKRLKRKHLWLYGGSKGSNAIRDAFQSGNADILVANAKKGGIAIDLNRADYMAYYESPADPITRAQSEARPLAERAGRLLTMEDVISCPMEARVLSFIKEGKDIMHELITKRDFKALTALRV